MISKDKRAVSAIFVSTFIMGIIAGYLQFVDIGIFEEFSIIICSSIILAVIIRKRVEHRIRIIETMKAFLYIGISIFTFFSLIINYSNWSEDTLVLNLCIIIVSVAEGITNYKYILILDDLRLDKKES